MAEKVTKTASVLAFERKLANSDALMFSGKWENRESPEKWRPVPIQSKDVRGTISNRLKNKGEEDPAHLDAEVQKANLQRVEVAALPFDSDSLKLTFSLRILGNLATPSACNDQTYQVKLAEKINEYIESQRFVELSLRYAENIANGRFLWRNRVGAEAIEVVVSQIHETKETKQWRFNGQDFALREFSQSNDRQITDLAEIIQQGLLGDSFVLLHVDAYARLGKGQEIFPSQELVLNKTGKDEKSKVLYQVEEIAAIHSQKIGNALRTIDTWYPGAEELGPISVEPYGSVTSRGIAYRQPSKKLDFYTLLDNWIVKDQEPETEQQHYVIAGLIRGGVFGEKGE